MLPFLQPFLLFKKDNKVPLTCCWDFGDDNYGIGESVQHSYILPGSYCARVFVMYKDSDSDSSSILVTVHDELDIKSVRIFSDIPKGKVPLDVCFSTKIDGGNPPFSYKWDFGDSKNSTEETPSHTYQEAGNYIAYLTITDIAGNQGYDAIAIQAKDDIGDIKSNIAASTRYGVVPLSVDFSLKIEGDFLPTTLSWDFGDQINSPDATPSHIYNESGVYCVAVKAIDALGQETTATEAVRVLEDFSIDNVEVAVYPKEGMSPLRSQFYVQVNGGNPPFEYNWKLGAGMTSTVKNPIVTFPDYLKGAYPVYVTVTDIDGDEFQAKTTVCNRSYFEDDSRLISDDSTWWRLKQGIAEVDVLKYSSSQNSLSSAFTFSASINGGCPPYSYKWSFGDGTFSEEQEPTHIYDSTGIFTATVEIVDSGNSVGRGSLVTVVPEEQQEVISVINSPDKGVTPHCTRFRVENINQTNDFTYFWDFDDGTTSQAEQPEHTYQTPGMYGTRLMLSDANGEVRKIGGCVTNVEKDKTIEKINVYARFIKSVSPHLLVHFAVYIEGGNGPFYYNWNFGDGYFSDEVEPLHLYKAPLTYTAVVNVTDADGDSDLAGITVDIPSILK